MIEQKSYGYAVTPGVVVNRAAFIVLFALSTFALSAQAADLKAALTYTQQQKLTASDGAGNDRFGYSIALSGDGNTALIGAYQQNSYQGAAYVFTRSATGWAQQQKLVPSDSASNDEFGFSVALSSDGSTALVGARAKNPPWEPRMCSPVLQAAGSSSRN